MTRLIRLLAVLALVAGVVAAPAPVPAKAGLFGGGWKPKTVPASKRVIEVVDSIRPSAWRVSKAVNWLDRYTASDMRMVPRCTGRAYMCVTFRSGRVTGNRIGYTRNRVITIDTSKAMKGKWKRYYRHDSRRTWLLAHELGHVFGLGHTGSRNLMNPYVSRGRLALWKSQRAHLRKR